MFFGDFRDCGSDLIEFWMDLVKEKSEDERKKKRLQDQWSNSHDSAMIVLRETIIQREVKIFLGARLHKWWQEFFEFWISCHSREIDPGWLMVNHRSSWFSIYLKLVWFCLIHHFDLLCSWHHNLKQKRILLNRFNKKMIKHKNGRLFLLKQSSTKTFFQHWDPNGLW